MEANKPTSAITKIKNLIVILRVQHKGIRYASQAQTFGVGGVKGEGDEGEGLRGLKTVHKDQA